MTDDIINVIVGALALPPQARVDTRIAKKLLTEHGAPTSADKRAIQEGIDDLQWLAVCKPTTIGIPAFTDADREYLEIAVLACAFRPGAKASRLIELIHRAVPYPVMLITTLGTAATLSVAHKRKSLGETGKQVVEAVTSVDLHLDGRDSDKSSMSSLALSAQPGRDLFMVYEGWRATIEAILATRAGGSFTPTHDSALIARRREALDMLSRNAKDIAGLRSKARREKQMSRRVELNLQIQRLEADVAARKKDL